jgi:protein-disulfide isomerase
MPVLTLPVEKRDHVRGNPDGLVTLVEYGDLECPHCGVVYPVVKRLVKEAGNKLRFVFRHFPLRQSHPHAFRAACAAEAAGLQGKFWEMHDLIYEHQDTLRDEDLVDFARQIGLDLNQFADNLDSQDTEQRVQEDFMSGVRSGVNGTPTFFINGIRYDGLPYYYDLRTAIELALKENRL